MSKLLIDDKPVMVLPKLAVAIGLNEAIVLQQIHYWLKVFEEARAANHYHDGRWWVYNTREEWSKNFPWWKSEATAWRALIALRDSGLVIAGNYNKLKIDRTLWYTIDYKALHELELAIVSNSNNGSYQVDTMDCANLIPALPETTTKTNPESVVQAPRPHTPATADDLMPAHLRGWLENNQPATGELLDTDQALAQLEANAPYKAAIIKASRDKRETGRNSAPLREAAQRARELGFMPEQILAAFSMADGSYWRATSFGRNGERPYVSNICQMIDEAATHAPLPPEQAKALDYLISYQTTKRATGWENGAGELAKAAGHKLGGVDKVTAASRQELVEAIKAVAA
jgi:hypothetical protein